MLTPTARSAMTQPTGRTPLPEIHPASALPAALVAAALESQGRERGAIRHAPVRIAIGVFVLSFVAKALIRFIPALDTAMQGSALWSGLVLVPIGACAIGALPAILRACRALTFDLTESRIEQMTGKQDMPKVDLEMRLAVSRTVALIALLLGYWVFVGTFEIVIESLLPVRLVGTVGALVRGGAGVAAVLLSWKTWVAFHCLQVSARRIAAENLIAARKNARREAGLEAPPAPSRRAGAPRMAPVVPSAPKGGRMVAAAAGRGRLREVPSPAPAGRRGLERLRPVAAAGGGRARGSK